MRSHTARDLLKAEFEKLTPWQIALFDKNGILHRHAKTIFKDVDTASGVLAGMVNLCEAIMAVWEEVNAAIAAKARPDAVLLKKLSLMVSAITMPEDGAPDELKELTKYNLTAKAVSGAPIIEYLKEWNDLRNAVETAGTTRLSPSHIEQWMDTMSSSYSDAAQVAESLEEIETFVKGVETAVNEFEKEFKEFMKTVAHEEVPNNSGGTSFGSRMLAGGALGTTEWNSLRASTRTAFQSVMSFSGAFLKATRLLLATFRDGQTLISTTVVSLHSVAKAAAADFTANKEEVPEDLKATIAALGKV